LHLYETAASGNPANPDIDLLENDFAIEEERFGTLNIENNEPSPFTIYCDLKLEP
jgi:hypothetical protein